MKIQGPKLHAVHNTISNTLHYFNSRNNMESVCVGGVRKWFDIPEDAKAIRFRISNRPTKNSYKGTVRKTYPGAIPGAVINGHPDDEAGYFWFGCSKRAARSLKRGQTVYVSVQTYA